MRKFGHTVHNDFDTAISSAYDLSKGKNQSRLKALIPSADFVFFSPPCLTACIAFDPALRSVHHQKGVPGLSKELQELVNNANVLFRTQFIDGTSHVRRTSLLNGEGFGHDGKGEVPKDRIDIAAAKQKAKRKAEAGKQVERVLSILTLILPPQRVRTSKISCLCPHHSEPEDKENESQQKRARRAAA